MKILTAETIVKMGFIPTMQAGLFSKVVSDTRLPPFYIKVEIHDPNPAYWRVLKNDHLVTLVKTEIELNKTIEVLTQFKQSTFLGGSGSEMPELDPQRRKNLKATIIKIQQLEALCLK